AVPQLRYTLTYHLPARTRFALDTFPEQSHAPQTDHGDFTNVMPDRLMKLAVGCINRGENCDAQGPVGPVGPGASASAPATGAPGAGPSASTSAGPSASAPAGPSASVSARPSASRGRPATSKPART